VIERGQQGLDDRQLRRDADRRRDHVVRTLPRGSRRRWDAPPCRRARPAPR
jgi:hypothetical protein